MFRKKKLIALALVVYILSISLTACGSPAENTPASGNIDVDGTIQMPLTGVEVSASLFSQPVNINMISYRSTAMETHVAQFQKDADGIDNLDFNITYLQQSDVIQQETLALPSGSTSPYEIMQCTDMSFGNFVAKGWLYPLNDLIEKYDDVYDFSDISQASWDAFTYDGKIYGIPISIDNQIMFYRNDIFEQLNLEPPTTVDELLDCLETIKQSGLVKYPLVMTFGQPGGLMTEFGTALVGMGGEWYDEDLNPLFNGPEGVAAIEMMQELYSYMPEAALSYTNDDSMVLMQTGEAAVSIIWAARAARMDDETSSTVVGKVSYAAAPIITEGNPPWSYQGQDVLCIPHNVAIDPETAFIALAEMTSKAAMAEVGKVQVVTRASALTDDVLAAHPDYQASFDTSALGPVGFSGYEFTTATESIIGTRVAEALTGDRTPQEALDLAAQEVTDLLIDMGYKTA